MYKHGVIKSDNFQASSDIKKSSGPPIKQSIYVYKTQITCM